MALPATPFQYSLTVEGEYVVKMRLEPAKASPVAYHSMLGLESFVNRSSKLESSLLDLIKMRASQINGCAFSIDMYSKDARANGETEQRLYALSAWQETSFFTNRERAALAWTEALTLITEGRAPDEVYAEVRKEFGEEEIVNLSIAIIAVNAWNRLAIAFRKIPGEYQPVKTS
jgi:AhpD family alkylhydroperoxidase